MPRYLSRAMATHEYEDPKNKCKIDLYRKIKPFSADVATFGFNSPEKLRTYVLALSTTHLGIFQYHYSHLRKWFYLRVSRYYLFAFLLAYLSCQCLPGGR